MPNRPTLLLTTLLLSIALSAPLAAAPVIGEPAPEFELTDTAGTTHRLSDFRGRTVILEWTNHECPFVQKHYDSDNMQDQQRTAAGEHDAVWLTIISSKPGAQGHVGPEQADALTASRSAAPTAVLIDESGDVGRAYAAQVTPHMYIIDGEGTLVYMGGIDSNPSADPADIPTSTQYVLAALDDLAAGRAVAEPVTRPYGCTIKY
ncbi:thioredoxin family protein [Wenzhouxiangella sp. XN79A]|nr:thioredoxin family protein [Wenzhouxiangella sp. XN79A]NKI35193.1 thioredoxin family protein [Wenzhouxiangella sp. XN79A]